MPDPSSDLSATRALVDAALQSAGALPPVQLGACVKTAYGRSIWEADFDGIAAIVKHHTANRHGSVEDRIALEVTALQDRARLLDQRRLGREAPARVPQVLASHPALGFYILEKVRGLTGNMLLTPDDVPMPYLFPSAALWLGSIVAASNSSNQIALGYWQKHLQKDPKFDIEDTEHAQLYAAIQGKTLEYVPNAAGQITKTLGHGDFQPSNLLIDDQIVYAFDFQSHQMRPAVQEIVHFCIRTNALCQTSGSEWGFDPDLLAPFKAILPDGEMTRLFPLFLGHGLMESFRHSHRWTPRSNQRRDALADRFLAHVPRP